MKLKTLNLYACLNLLSVMILLVGLGSAILIYRTAEDTPYGALGYEEAGGTAYPVMPEDSKQYLRGLELYGGKANVLMDQLRRGFIGLWHGKSLALTVACITLFVTFGVFYTANYLLPSRFEPDNPGEKDRDGTDG
jgi:hypothetical protein